MILLDTNILVHAAGAQSLRHAKAKELRDQATAGHNVDAAEDQFKLSAGHPTARRYWLRALHPLPRHYNVGAENMIYTGGDKPSYLLLPVIPRKKRYGGIGAKSVCYRF